MIRGLLLLSLALAACGRDGGARPQPRSAAAPDASPPPKKTVQVTPPFDVVTPPADAERLPDGLVFTSIVDGTGAAPGRNDGVTMTYAAWRKDGSTFATTEPSGQPTTQWLFAVAPGFSEALMKMKVGGTAMFWVPAALAVLDGAPHGQPEPIAYKVDLLDVVVAPPTPPDVAGAPSSARKTSTALVWQTVKEGPPGGENVRSWDKVSFTYTGWDATGRIVDSTELLDKPVGMAADKLPPVFAEVLPHLAVGDRARLWFPGAMLGGGASAPKGTVCYEVEVTAIDHRNEPPPAPADVAAPPAEARTTPRGVSYVVLRQGTGLLPPTTSDQVTVSYTGWTADGKRFDSSIPDGKPRQLRVAGMMPGWSDAVQQMVVGDVWRIWVPARLAFEGQPHRPQGMLVLEVELLAIEPLPIHPPRKPAAKTP